MIHILQKIFPEKSEFINEFNDFSTYLTGFHINRENYYTTKDEKSTAIATRIVHENLPKFCQNIFAFFKKKDDYIASYEKISHKTLQIKDSRTGEMKKFHQLQKIFLKYHSLIFVCIKMELVIIIVLFENIMSL